MNRKLILIAAIALMAVVLAGAGWWWRDASALQGQIAGLLPVPPDLSSSPDAMRAEIVGADGRARGIISSRRGLVELSQLYHANGFLEEAMQCYSGLGQIQPNEPRWPHLLATIKAGYGEIETAMELWQRTIELAPDYLPAMLRYGDCQLKANHPGEAAVTYAKILEKYPNEPYALLGLARLDLEASRWEKARERLEIVVSKTNYTLGYDLIVSLYERLGMRDRATTIRASAKASGAFRDPDDPWLDQLLDYCYDPYRLALSAGTISRNGDLTTAIKLLERAVAIVPNDVSARFQLGALWMQKGNQVAAEEQFRLCTELAPEFADGWANLSSLQAQTGRANAAERTLADGLKNCPDSPGLHLMQARNHKQAGRVGEAITEFQTSIRLRSNEADAYLELGNLYITLGREAEAVALMRQAIEAEPGNPVALGILAFAAISSGDETEARRWLTQVRNQPRVQREQAEQLRAAFQKQFGRAP